MTAPAPTPFATAEDIQVRLARTFTDPEKLQVEAFIRDVSALMRVKRPLIDTARAAGQISDDILVAFIFQVASRMVSSAARGAGVKSETYAEWGYSLTDAAARGLHFTDDELEMLNGAAAPSSSGAYSLQLYR